MFLFLLGFFLWAGVFSGCGGGPEEETPPPPPTPWFCENPDLNIFPPSITISVVPQQGKVPFQATIKAYARPGSDYTEIVKYQWDLNGDQIYDLETESDELGYEFIEPYRYTISVQVFDNCNLFSNEQINVDARQNLPPIINSFMASPDYEGEAPFDVNLLVQAIDPDGVLIRADWDLDNDPEGEFEFSTYPVSPGYHVLFDLPYTFAKAGWYRARVRVADDSGAMTVSNELTIKVKLGIRKVFCRDYGSGDVKGIYLEVDEETNSAIAYTAMGKAGMVIFKIPDLSDPSRVILIARAETAGIAWEIEKHGDLVFLAHGDYGLMVFYVSNPYFPIWLGQMPICKAEDVDIGEYGGRVFAFVACEFPMMLQVFDVTRWYDPSYDFVPSLYSYSYTPETGGQPKEAVAVRWDPRGYIYLGVKFQGAVVYDFSQAHFGAEIPFIGVAPSLENDESPVSQRKRSSPVDVDFTEHPDGHLYLNLVSRWESGPKYGCGEVATYDVTDLESEEGSLLVFGEALNPVYPGDGTASAFLRYRATPYEHNDWGPATLYRDGERLKDGAYSFKQNGAEVVIGPDFDPEATYAFDYIRKWIGRVRTICWSGYWYPPEGINADGDLSYVAGGGWGMQIVDNSDPENPYMAISPGLNYIFDPNDKGNDWVYEVEASGDTLFIADGWLGLTVADNRMIPNPNINPSSPAEMVFAPEVLQTYSTSGQPQAMFLRRPDLMVAIGTGGVDVLDTSYPSNPPIVANIDTPGEVVGLWESENREYVFLSDRNIEELSPDPADEDALWVADRNYLSHDTSALITSWPDDPGEISEVKGVWGSGNRLYFFADQLNILDVSDPEDPYLLGAVDIPSNQIIVRDDDLVYYLRQGGIEIMDCSSPVAPFVAGGFFPSDDNENFEGLDVQGDYAYVTDGTRLRVLDVSYPEAVSEVASITVAENASQILSVIRVIGNYAFLGGPGLKTQKGGLAIVDVTNPQALNIMGDYPDDFIFGFEGFLDEQAHYFYLYTILETTSGSKQFCVFKVSGLD